MIAVDASWMVGQYRGMGAFARALLEPVSNKVHALLPKRFPQAPYPTIRGGSGFFPWWEQVTLPRLCKEIGVKKLLCPYNTAPIHLSTSVELLLVVHDLIYMEPWKSLPPSVSPYQILGRVYRQFVVPRCISRASKIVTVSEYMREQISTRFSVPKNILHVISNSLNEEWFKDEPLSLDKRKPYLLAVSGEAPNKNLQTLIRVFAAFRERLAHQACNITLRIVGIKPIYQKFFKRIAERYGVDKFVRFEPFLTESTLRNLYREAWLFVMPSLFEGFGIPALEAMACGTPVACSKSASLPEVVGNASWLFDPRDPNDMVRVLVAAWTDHRERFERSCIGLLRATHFRRASVAESIAKFWDVA